MCLNQAFWRKHQEILFGLQLSFAFSGCRIYVDECGWKRPVLHFYTKMFDCILFIIKHTLVYLAAKPGNRTTESLKKARERSTSVDSQVRTHKIILHRVESHTISIRTAVSLFAGIFGVKCRHQLNGLW